MGGVKGVRSGRKGWRSCFYLSLMEDIGVILNLAGLFSSFFSDIISGV